MQWSSFDPIAANGVAKHHRKYPLLRDRTMIQVKRICGNFGKPADSIA